MRRDIEPSAEAERLRDPRDRDGYEAFKIRIGSICGHDEDQWPGRTEEIVPTVRDALGDDIDLFVDANSCYTPERAIEVARLLEEHDVALYEEPRPYWELGWTREVADAVPRPVSGGEQTNDPAQWRRIADERIVDVVQPDVYYVGGFSRAVRIAELTADAGLPCMPHSANHSLVTVFSLHLLAGVDNPGPHVEFSVEPQWADGTFEPALTVEDGAVEVPDGPGWGVRLDPTWLSDAEHRVSDRN